VVNRLGAVGPPWTDGGADRGCQSAVARSPEYGPRPLRCTKAHWRGRKREREEPEELGSGLIGARAMVWRPGDGGAEQEATALGGSEARAWREVKRGWERCGEVRGWCSPFYRRRGSTRGGGRGLTPVLMALTPLKMGGAFKRGIKGWGK
jgi:hypothetical protein